MDHTMMVSTHPGIKDLLTALLPENAKIRVVSHAAHRVNSNQLLTPRLLKPMATTSASLHRPGILEHI
jgi:hypothetical protein